MFNIEKEKKVYEHKIEVEPTLDEIDDLKKTFRLVEEKEDSATKRINKLTMVTPIKELYDSKMRNN